MQPSIPRSPISCSINNELLHEAGAYVGPSSSAATIGQDFDTEDKSGLGAEYRRPKLLLRIARSRGRLHIAASSEGIG